MDEKEVIWTLKAIQDKIEILNYWNNRNKSQAYGRKLDRLIDKVIAITAKNPESGKVTDYKNIRIKVVSNYLIFYRIQQNCIEIIRIWDSRRDTRSLRLP